MLTVSSSAAMRRGHDLVAAIERPSHEGGLLAHPPIVVGQSAQEQLGDVLTVHLRDLLDGNAPRFGLGLLQKPADGCGGLAHVDPGRGASDNGEARRGPA
jgi:hypothetical protein